MSARIRRPTISSTDFSCCNSVSTVEPAGDFSLQSQGTLKPETRTEACPSSPSSVKAPKNEERRTNLEGSDTPSQNADFCNFLFKRALTLSILLIRHHHHSLLLLLLLVDSQARKQTNSVHEDMQISLLTKIVVFSLLLRKNSLLQLRSSSSSTEPPLLVKRSKA